MKVGKFYTGNKHCFQGTIEPLEVLEKENTLRVKLTNLERTMVWEEHWNLNHSIQGLKTGEYIELGEICDKCEGLGRVKVPFGEFPHPCPECGNTGRVDRFNERIDVWLRPLKFTEVYRINHPIKENNEVHYTRSQVRVIMKKEGPYQYCYLYADVILMEGNLGLQTGKFAIGNTHELEKQMKFINEKVLLLKPELKIIPHKTEMEILEYEDWYALNEEKVNIELAENGADRELDFDSEFEFYDRYAKYLKVIENAEEDEELIHPKCKGTGKCQETEGLKGTEYEGTDMCTDGCVHHKPKTQKEEWDERVTPKTDSNPDIQKALDWWHSLAIQNLQDMSDSWVGHLWKYFPDKTHPYHLTKSQIHSIYTQEHPNT